MLTVKGLTKSFGGVPVVAELDLTVNAGEVVALVGDNGAGKTTTLRCIVGAEDIDGGAVYLDGQPLDDRRPEIRRAVCSLLDDHAWFPDLTVAEHLALYARAHGEEAHVIVDAMDELDIAHVGDQLPGTLSSGQTQRFRLAQAMVRPWRLLVLDEPEQRLDADGRALLGGWLATWAGEGRAVLMASHDPVLQESSGARRIVLTR